jgi:hypothetical protein
VSHAVPGIEHPRENNDIAGNLGLWRIAVGIQYYARLCRPARIYINCNRVEMVFTQTTKAHLLGIWTERNDVADFDSALSDHHAVDQQFHNLAPPGKVGVGQARPNPLAEVSGRCRTARELRLAIHLGFQLVRLLFHCPLLTLVFRQGNGSEEICPSQTLQLTVNAEMALAQLLAPGLDDPP